jgi:hypothetical protein
MKIKVNEVRKIVEYMQNMCDSLEHIIQLLFNITVHVQCKPQLVHELNIDY